MSGRYLLDTNIVVALFNTDPEVEARLETAPQVFLCSTVLGELHYGAAHSGRPDDNAARIEDFASTCFVVEVDAHVARRYGRVKAELRKKGRPIPENDIWIAACARQHGLTLVTRDRHFDQVEGLQTEAW